MAGTLEELAYQLNAYACLQALQQEELAKQKRNIDSLHAMLMQLLKIIIKKKNLKRGKKKRTLNPLRPLKRRKREMPYTLKYPPSTRTFKRW